MIRYLLVEIHEDGPKTRADVTQLDDQSGAALSTGLTTLSEWTMGEAHNAPLAVALAVEELLR